METKKRGPKPEYNSEYCDKLLVLMGNGALDCEIFASWGIARDTYYRWLNEHDEFKAAHEEGLPLCESWWTVRMREKFLSGDDKGFKYCQMIMRNKFGFDPAPINTNGGSNNISIGSIQVLQTMSKESLIEDVQTYLSKLTKIIPQQAEMLTLDQNTKDSDDV